jgi:protein O-GlcNAc transferase
MKNIISFSLWGDHPMYWKGAIENIKLANRFYPGWICRFYIDKNSDKDLIESIKGNNVEVFLIDSIKGEFHGAFWRFWASEEEDVNVFLSRDCDSRISEREVLAVNEWLNSDKDFHIMRDHPYHTVPILAGMWGSKNGLMKKIGLSNLMNKWSKYSNKGVDQDFLGLYIYPLILNNSMEHSEFNLRFGGEIKNFPSKRKNYEYVGDVFDEDNQRHPDFWKML